MKVSVRLLKTVEEVREITSEWKTLLERSDCHQVFSSIVWYLVTLEVFTEFKPWVCVVEEQGEVQGIAPLVINPVNQVSFLSDLADYQDFIVTRNDKKTVAQLFHALNNHKCFDKLSLSGLPDRSQLLSIIDDGESLFDDIKFKINTCVNRCYYLDLSEGYDAYMKRFNAKARSNFRRMTSKAKEQNIEMKELFPEDISGDKVAEHFLRLHLFRFPDKLFSRKKPQQFCRRLLPLLFNKGLLRVFVLQQEDRIIAIKLSVQDTSGLGYWNGGFDTTFSSIAPGKLLMLYQIKICCDEGIKVFDLLRGEDPYKLEWQSGYKTIASVHLE